MNIHKPGALMGAVVAVAVMLVSCQSVSTMQKDIKRMDIHFKPLEKSDFTLVGELEAQVTITGKGSGTQKVLDKEYAADLKRGLISKSEATEIMYFAPTEGKSITGSLYENDIFNSVFGTVNLGAPKFGALFPGLRNMIKAARPAPPDYGMDFAYFALVEKYPDVDYFINVRFDRKTIFKGQKFTETVIVKADGVKLRTDN